MIKFPSINQFRQVCKNVAHRARFVGLDDAGEPVYNGALPLPTMRFIGTVKLHGTNAAIVFSPTGVTFQSRERELTETEDNAGFYNHMIKQHAALHGMYANIATGEQLDPMGDHTIAVFGEWCGGNIQGNTGLALAKLPKMFVIFAIQVNGEWVDFRDIPLLNSEARIFHINQFPKYSLDVDFNHPELSQNKLVAITESVEAQCPVGACFDVNGIGEGVVWRCANDWNPEMWFKVKGDKHSASKVKTLSLIDVEGMQAVAELIAQVVTEGRLEQGLAWLTGDGGKTFELRNIGDFLRWVHGDIVKEEMDLITAANIDPKKLGGPIAKVAKQWYFERLNAEAMV